jgi:uncharacterized Zn finger protein (UPF0148 family)
MPLYRNKIKGKSFCPACFSESINLERIDWNTKRTIVRYHYYCAACEHKFEEQKVTNADHKKL